MSKITFSFSDTALRSLSSNKRSSFIFVHLICKILIGTTNIANDTIPTTSLPFQLILSHEYPHRFNKDWNIMKDKHILFWLLNKGLICNFKDGRGVFSMPFCV